MRLEHHLVGGYVRYISPHIIIIIINTMHKHYHPTVELELGHQAPMQSIPVTTESIKIQTNPAVGSWNGFGVVRANRKHRRYEAPSMYASECIHILIWFIRHLFHAGIDNKYKYMTVQCVQGK